MDDPVISAAIDAAEPAVAALRHSLGKAYSAERLEQAASLDQVHQLIAGVIVMLQSGPIARIKELERRLAEIESQGVQYCGVYQKALGYRRGSLVTSGGALWACLADAPEGVTPGTNPAYWQLAQKSTKPTKRVAATGRPA